MLLRMRAVARSLTRAMTRLGVLGVLAVMLGLCVMLLAMGMTE